MLEVSGRKMSGGGGATHALECAMRPMLRAIFPRAILAASACVLGGNVSVLAGCTHPVDDYVLADGASEPQPDANDAAVDGPADAAVAFDTAVDAAKETKAETPGCDPRQRCGGVCVDLTTDPANCGKCGTTCDVAGGEKCRDSKCK